MQFTAQLRRTSSIYRNWAQHRRRFGILHGVKFCRTGRDYVADDPAQVAANLAALTANNAVQVASFAGVVPMTVAEATAPRAGSPDHDAELAELLGDPPPAGSPGVEVGTENEPMGAEDDQSGAEVVSQAPQGPRRGRPPKAGGR